MQTPKDQEVVAWIAALGAAGAEHVMARFAMGRSWAYARLSKLVADGLLEQRLILYRQPGLYVATRDGLRWCGLERLGVFRVSPGGFNHAWEVARVAAALAIHDRGARVVSDRELRMAEVDERRLIASVQLGELPGGRPAFHRPDLAVLGSTGVVAVEVELTVKAPARLRSICRAYARARHLDAVVYLAQQAPARAVERAIGEVRAEDRIRVLAADRPELLLAAARGGVLDVS